MRDMPTSPEDLFGCVREREERVLYEYGSTAAALRREGAVGFFLPALGGGLLLVFIGIIARAALEGARTYAPVLSFLGVMLCASATLLYAMFLRRARMAESTALYITDRRVVYITGGSYAVFPLAEITDARTERAERMSRVPFDLSALEGVYLVLCSAGGETRLPFVEGAEDASAKILTLVG